MTAVAAVGSFVPRLVGDLPRAWVSVSIVSIDWSRRCRTICIYLHICISTKRLQLSLRNDRCAGCQDGILHLKVQFRKNPYKPYEWFVIGNSENPVGFCKKKHQNLQELYFLKEKSFSLQELNSDRQYSYRILILRDI